MFFAGSPPLPPKTLFIRSNWKPDDNEIPMEFRSRVSHFITETQRLFKRSRCPSNLVPLQTTALIALQQRRDLIVWKTDKNLGPAIIERDTYVKRALLEHLLDKSTYRQLSENVANGRIKAIRKIVNKFISKYFPAPARGYQSNEEPRVKANRIFLERSILDEHVKDPFAYFYMLAKIHKNPWTTRPIVSCSGSLLHGLGRWIDSVLQRICRHLPFALRSSMDLISSLQNLGKIPTTARFFTCDATSMYTNIDTDHALTVIHTFLKQSNLPASESFNVDALMAALRIVMQHNVFRFGDTFWLQTSGTAMGTPPAPMYATLYFALHEAKIVPLYPELILYRRFIDDGFGIWVPDPDGSRTDDNLRWQTFQQQFSSYGKLSWEFSARVPTVDFLDLTIYVNEERVETRLFEKALNLYLYLPSHSAHPPGVLKGLITGMLLRIQRLTTQPTLRSTAVQNFYTRLRARGYSPETLLPLFRSSPANSRPHILNRCTNGNLPLFLHIPFHPCDPPSNVLQRSFREKLLHPPGEPLLPNLRNKRGVAVGVERFIIAYHRPRNLGNLLAPRRFNTGASPVSSYIVVPVEPGRNDPEELRHSLNPE